MRSPVTTHGPAATALLQATRPPRPSPALAALLSFVLPGLGQAYAGERRRAFLWALPTLVLAAVVVGLLILHRDLGYVAGLFLEPSSLLVILVVDLVFLAYRIVAIVDAWRVAVRVSARSPLPGRRAARAGLAATAVLIAITVGAQGLVAWVDWNAYDLVSGVFASGSGDGPAWGDGGVSLAEGGAPSGAGAVDASTGIVDASPGASGAPGASAGAGTVGASTGASFDAGASAGTGTGASTGTATTGTASTGAATTGTGPATTGPAGSADAGGILWTPSPDAGSPAPSASDTGVPYWARDGRLDVLVLGGDAGPGRDGLRTDSMMLVSVDVASGRAAIFGFPRNLVNVPLPPRIQQAYGCHCFPDMLSGYYRWAQSHPDLFSGSKTTRGYRALAEMYGNLTGRTIDGVAAADLNGFIRLVDALGGLTINVPYRIHDARYPREDGSGTIVLDIQPGLQTLPGPLALAFARSRHQDSDYGRMNRQQLVLVALRKQLNPCSMLPRLPDLVAVARDSLWTNIPSAQLPSLLALAEHVDMKRIARFAFTPPTYNETVTAADVTRIRATVRDAFKGAPPAPAPDGEGFLHC